MIILEQAKPWKWSREKGDECILEPFFDNLGETAFTAHRFTCSEGASFRHAHFARDASPNLCMALRCFARVTLFASVTRIEYHIAKQLIYVFVVFLYSQLCFCIFCISLTVVNKWYQTLLALFSIAHPCAGWMRVAKNNTILFLFNYLFLSNYCRNILFQIYVCVTVNQHWTNVLCPDFTSYL